MGSDSRIVVPSRKGRLFLCLAPDKLLGFSRNPLRLRLGFVIIGLEFHWSASRKVPKRVVRKTPSGEMPFMKLNGKRAILGTGR